MQCIVVSTIMYLSVPPKLAPSHVMKILKGKSAERLLLSTSRVRDNGAIQDGHNFRVNLLIGRVFS